MGVTMTQNPWPPQGAARPGWILSPASVQPLAVRPLAGRPLAGQPIAARPIGGQPIGGRAGLADILAGGTVRSGGEIGADNDVLPNAGLLPVLPALRDLLPDGALQRGSVVAADDWSLLCLALAAGPVAAGAWCAAAGLPHLGVRAAAEVGLDPARLLLIGDLGTNWAQVVASLLDGCDLVLLRPPERASAQVRRKLEAAVRRYGAVLLVAGGWAGAHTRLRVISREWTGVGTGHGRLRARQALVLADGRGRWARPRTRWLWLPGPDGSISAVTERDAPAVGSLPDSLPESDGARLAASAR